MLDSPPIDSFASMHPSHDVWISIGKPVTMLQAMTMHCVISHERFEAIV